MSRCCRSSGWRGGGGGRRRGPRGPLPPPPPRPRSPAAATTAQPPRTRYFRRREFPGSPTPRPHSPPPLSSAPALAPGSAPPRRGRSRGRGRGGLRLPARAAVLLTGSRAAPARVGAPPRLPAPRRAPRDAGPSLRSPRRLLVQVTPPDPTWRRGPGRIPEEAQLRGREEEALLAREERTHSAPSPSADPSAAHSPAPGAGSLMESEFQLDSQSPNLNSFLIVLSLMFYTPSYSDSAQNSGRQAEGA
ncbi:proline-rich protein 2-like [Panthera leo]|uniref:proline-rich protein 2-like n=1 Tax=Panthera leo TaxID=9689 RepID=UPI001C69F11C|nr:proline-rich protein 2-like [Panthera leo]